MGHSLSELSLRYVAVRDEDVSIEPAAGGVGGGRGTRVAGGGAEDGFRFGFKRLRYGDDHAAVFEGAGGIAHLQLEIQLPAADALVQTPRVNERRVALAQRDERRVGTDVRDPIAVAAKNARMARRFSLRPVAHPG